MAIQFKTGVRANKLVNVNLQVSYRNSVTVSVVVRNDIKRSGCKIKNVLDDILDSDPR